MSRMIKVGERLYAALVGVFVFWGAGAVILASTAFKLRVKRELLDQPGEVTASAIWLYVGIASLLSVIWVLVALFGGFEKDKK